MLEVSDSEFKITMITMLQVLLERLGNMHKQMENFIREVETIRRIRWKYLGSKHTHTVIELKNAFDDIIGRMDTKKEKVNLK